MALLSNILPAVFLGSFCLLFLALLVYYYWRRAARQRANLQLENPEYEVEEIPGTTDFVMVGRKGHRKKKVKKPKLWDVWVPDLGGKPVHERKLSSGSSLSDFSWSEDVGHWAGLKVGVSSSITSARRGKLIFVFLAHVCNLCQEPKQDPCTTYSFVLPPTIGPDPRTHDHHNRRKRTHERATELVPVLALTSPFSRCSAASHPWTPATRQSRRRDRLQDVQAQKTREHGWIR